MSPPAMVGTVLGKRPQTSRNPFDSPVSARAAKRLDTAQENDENCNPYQSQHAFDDFQSNHDSMLLDSPVKAPAISSQSTTTQSRSPIAAPQTPRHRDALSKQIPITPRHRVSVTGTPLTPRTLRTPSTPSATIRTVYSDARKTFMRGADPGQLVGRDKERTELLNFINEHISSAKGGALYVSGPPGTGKSALVSEVCLALGDTDALRYAHINCMSVKTATDIYGLAASSLDISDDVFGEGARDALRADFIQKTRKLSYLVVLDEIDQLLNLDLNVLYDLFEWSFMPGSKLILIGIANALDLTDRLLPRLKPRNLKPALLPFMPYTSSEIATVLTARCRSLLPASSSAASDFTPFLHPAAIQLISKKVASQTGDLRRSFDIAQQVIDLAESETKHKLSQQALANTLENNLRSPSKTPLGENLNLSSPRSPVKTSSPGAKSRCSQSSCLTTLLAQLTPETAPRATLAHVVRITSAAFGNSLLQRFKALNLQQKAVLCSLAALERRNRQARSCIASPAMMPSPQTTPEKDKTNIPRTPGKRPGQPVGVAPTVRALREAYMLVCRRDNILHALSSTEFRDVVANLETMSMVAAADGKAGSLAAHAAASTVTRARGAGSFAGGMGAKGDERRVSAQLSAQDLVAAVEGVGGDILQSILADDGV